MIAIIDYDAGNMKSVEKAFQYLNEDVVITIEFQPICGIFSPSAAGIRRIAAVV